jgi:hypothetical protein
LRNMERGRFFMMEEEEEEDQIYFLPIRKWDARLLLNEFEYVQPAYRYVGLRMLWGFSLTVRYFERTSKEEEEEEFNSLLSFSCCFCYSPSRSQQTEEINSWPLNLFFFLLFFYLFPPFWW